VVSITAPDPLTTTTYVEVALQTVPGTWYKLLRQRSPNDAFITLIDEFQAVSTTTTILDQGQFVPVQYKPQRGNQYQLKELVKIRRVYALDNTGNQQPLVPTDIDTLSGIKDESWDQTSGTILGEPAFTPQWLAQPAQTFPVRSPYYARVPVSLPWRNTLFGNQVPMYYLRGGFIGILPPPQLPVQVCIDYIPRPPDFTTGSDESIYPDGFLDAICFKMLEYMSISDDDTREDSFRTRYEAEVRKLRIAYVDTIQGDKPHSLVPLTIRTQMREWPTGNNGGGYGW